MASRPQREPGGHGLTDTPRVMKKTPKRTFTASTAGLQDECSYITKDRIVRVNESYLQRILEECENAKQAFAAAIAATNSQSTVPCDSHVLPETDSEIHISNPLVEDKAWFVPISTVDNPVYIGDSACSSFATGIRRALDTSCSRAAHPPRHHYLSDGSLVLCSTDSLPWPTKVKASLLVRVALTYVGRLHHVVLPSVTIQRLDEVYEDLTVVTTLDAGKYLALFALGEAFSMKSYVEGRNEVPGLQYFIVASRMAQNIPERATVELVETILLLSFYSHILNRRHSAYNFIGTALRLKLGYAISVQDSSIGAEMPSFSGLDEKQMLDFADPDYSIATIKLARIVGDVMMTVYNRNQKQPFIRSVREISRNLKQWKINLPGSIRLPPGDPSTDLPKHLLYLNLFFNQASRSSPICSGTAEIRSYRLSHMLI
ncbi:hypothetical protein IFR05_008780 [Cadophora sp. M221]|nr:hypothetical protein IFR05_008780 [Cadophora sp. M221]